MKVKLKKKSLYKNKKFHVLEPSPDELANVLIEAEKAGAHQVVIYTNNKYFVQALPEELENAEFLQAA